LDKQSCFSECDRGGLRVEGAVGRQIAPASAAHLAASLIHLSRKFMTRAPEISPFLLQIGLVFASEG
jgi:hypothetical protein